IDPGRAAACLEAYRDRACNTFAQGAGAISPLPNAGDLFALCPDLLVGHVPDGKACNLVPECMRGSRCVATTQQPPVINGGVAGTFGGTGGVSGAALASNPGVCVPYQQQGEACNTSEDCDPAADLACRSPDFVCGPPAQEGDTCVQTDPSTGYPTLTP